ncbi:MAG TPA: phospholipid carrier-dependent glycosyltransferase [Rugosimonospora sp.]|nr:phospholipid carrier-dependent glycosyltransferase [Rugosimonospora sp.]
MDLDSPAQPSGPPPPQAGPPDVQRRRLGPSLPDDRFASWLGTGVVVFIAAVLRLVGLGWPKGKIFDEVYYATEGHDLLVHGVEWNATNNNGDFVVHPPLGKWIIGLGEWIFGYNEFGWRISAAVAGTLSVLIMVRLARRMFGSTILGCAAGLLMALDGLHFVLSRSALLDIFLMLFILAAFGCLLLDRDARRRRWLDAIEAGADPSRAGRDNRPRFDLRTGVPWWRLLAGVMTGCAMAVKWSALWYILLFVLLIYLWEVGARKSAGVRHRWRDALLDETGWVAAFLLIIVVVYLASWTGWFATNDGYDRHWINSIGHHEVPVISALQNLWHYHMDALHFHDTLVAKHLYQSWPWQWLLLGRPVAFYWNNCGGSCASEVLLLGTPILWWSFIPALLALVWFGVSRRDWRTLAIGLGAAAGIVPWFNWELDNRTMFYFYAMPAEPFLILAVVYVLGCLMRAPARSGAIARITGDLSPGGYERVPGPDRRMVGAIVAGVYVLIIALCFAYFYPIYVGKTLTYAQWYARMWLGGRWI